MMLREEEARVLGALVEKAQTTPQQYPLTLAALVAACNQTSNRDPVVTYDDHEVLRALDDLKGRRLVRFVLPSHGRSAVRYRQVLDETLALDARQSALFAVLLLRGPQTVGELRLRTERMTQFDRLEDVEHELALLAGLEVPLANKLDRRPGQKEERWVTPVVTPNESQAATPGALDDYDNSNASRPPPTVGGDAHADHGAPVADGGLTALRQELATVRAEVAELRQALEELRDSLGG